MSEVTPFKTKPAKPTITTDNYAQFQNMRTAIAAMIRKHFEARLDRILLANAADRTERAQQAQRKFARSRR